MAIVAIVIIEGKVVKGAVGARTNCSVVEVRAQILKDGAAGWEENIGELLHFGEGGLLENCVASAL